MMLRQRENPDALRAGMFSVLVHALLLGALLISFNWKTTHPVRIAQVELWDSVPAVTQKPAPVPEPVPEPAPVVKEIPKPAPVVEPEVKPEPKVEIAIEKKPPEKKIEKPIKKEPPKPDTKAEDARKKLLEQMRQEDLKSVPKAAATPSNDAIKKLQQEFLSEDKAAGQQSASAASAGVVDEFKAKIQAKIRSNVNKTLCGNANPELIFEIGLIPTGELSGAPKLIKSSGNSACDDAVERAIRVSEPLPLPQDASLFSQFRNLKLKFKPNES